MSIRGVLQGFDEALARGQRAMGRALRRSRQQRVVPFRGWVTRDKAVVLGRVVEDDTAVKERLARSLRILQVTYERFATLPVRGASVRVSWNGREVPATTDGGGFVDVTLPREDGPGADHATLAIDGGQPQTAQLFIAEPHAAIGFISDIDDTVLETDLQNPLRRALQLVYSEQRMRLPFDGIAALYQAFVASGSPAFYVSNAPWNLYGHVIELLDHHAIPKGPVLLRDQRIVERRATAAAGQVHKQIALRRLVEDHPALTFVLLGDSSRHDPLRYVEVAEQHPGRVAAIYIRRVAGILARREDLGALSERAKRAGVEMLVADDTVSIAQHAASRGFIVRSEVGHVRQGKLEDEAAPRPGAGMIGS